MARASLVTRHKERNMPAETNVLLTVLIYLAAMVLVVPVAKRFGLGVVLGYLLAGLAIGPFGLGLSKSDSSIALLAELGIVLMLFTIGLELDIKRLWAMRLRVFGFGAAQVALCGLALAVGVYALGLTPTAALILGLTLALSSTAVAVQLMNDRNLMGSSVGQGSFGILLFQDMAAIPILIAISLLFPSEGAKGFQPLLALAAVVGVVLAGRFAVGYVLGWVAKNGSRELFVGAALLMVIAVMELMTFVGVSAGLGAFIAGVMLASSEYRHELEADLEPFKGLFLGLFFITIGAAIDLNLLRAHWPQIVALLALYLVLKFALLYGLAVLFRMQGGNRISFMTILGQGSEFAFVVTSLAMSGKMISADQGAWVNLIVALSMAVSPLLMKAQDWAQAKWFRTAGPEREADKDMHQSGVIIAGFGRYGQIVGRLLLSNGIVSTVLDHDSEHIDSMRQFGFKIFYGDATRLDLLEVAGAHKAKVLVIAVDGKDDITQIAELAKKHFPHLHVVARAKDVPHMYELMKLGVSLAQRELFESALSSGRHALELLGHGRYEAKEMTDRFRHTNIEQVTRFAKLRDETERKDFIQALRESREELERQLREQAKQPQARNDWQDAKARAERE
jgi:glutathione-regulated potassium-efflux system ancillary protein KefC